MAARRGTSRTGGRGTPGSEGPNAGGAADILFAVDRLDREEWLVLQRSYPLAAVVIGDGDRDLRHVVRIVRFWQRVAEAGRIDVRARFAGRPGKKRGLPEADHLIFR